MSKTTNQHQKLWRNLSRWALVQNLPDLLSTRHHARDFLGSRCEHIHDRVRVLAILFSVSVLLWIPIDAMTVSSETFGTLTAMRFAMALCYLGLAIWNQQCHSPAFARLRLLLLVLLPCLFYLASRSLLGSETSDLSQMVYDFYPFVIVVQLAIFPLTLIEGILLALPVFVSIVLSSDNPYGTLWLLSLLTILTLWAQSSQLHMLLRLYRQATRDPLTGLFNRRMLVERLETELDRAKRYDRPLAILLMDLDKFKRVNDTYGHLTGDYVLKRFSRIVEDSLRGVDMVGRYGGEEFLAVLPETDPRGAQDVADRIRQACHEVTVTATNKEQVSFTTSIGIASNTPEEDLTTLINRADEALYGAKEAGRDRIIVAE